MTQRWAPIAAPLEHVIVPPKNPASTYPTLILLHGRGADATDLLQLANELNVGNFLILAPQAPYTFGTPFGMGYAWYEMDTDGDPDPASLQPSLAQVHGFLESISAGYPVDVDRVFLVGFSQGALMSLTTGLKHPNRLAGVIALSGYLPASIDLADRAGLKQLSVFLGHGVSDTIIPVANGREARDRLMAAGAEVTYREYPAPHTITSAEVQDIQDWIEQRLDMVPRQ